MLGIICGLVVANIALPPTVIATIVVAAIGGSGSIIACINACIDSYGYYCDAKDIYITIRTYGAKL